jgi:DNA-binding MurR/RpiR family transcriptional regulator
VDHFADRLRAAPQSRLQRGAAAEALELARELARRAQGVEEPGTRPREMPDAGMFAAADQITVAVHDLALVLSDEGQVEEVVELVAQAQKRAGV